MFDEGTFNLKRPDTVPRTLYYIVIPSYKPEISLGILEYFITGIIPAVYKGFPVLFRIIDIFNKEPGGRGLQEMASLPSIPKGTG